MSGNASEASSKVTQKSNEINFRNLGSAGILPYMETSQKITIGVVIVLVAGAIGFGIFASNKTGKYDELAQCIKDQGAQFFGAFWCPHCQKEKAMFGSSKKYLPYVECSTPDGQGQMQVCTDNNISGYPTWTFAKPIVLTTSVEPIRQEASEGSEFNDWVFTLLDGESVRVAASSEPTITETDGKKTYTFDNTTARFTGETSLSILASQTSCPLPQE
jgi:thiol-disulfide isomerase/thioredoxin